MKEGGVEKEGKKERKVRGEERMVGRGGGG